MALGAGCGAKQDTADLSYSEGAEVAFAEAMKDFDRGNCLEAEPAFRQVRKGFPFSGYAALSELRLSDCMFRQQKYAEAVEAYRRFVRSRPAHAELPYARFQIARSYFKQIPGDWFLAPPAHERDQSATKDALIQLQRFIADYPENELAEQARELQQKCLSRLARHELYVARYYVSKGKRLGAMGRLQGMLTTYPGSVVEPEAMLLLGRLYMEDRDRDRARRMFVAIRERYPETDEGRRAKGFLNRLGSPVTAPSVITSSSAEPL